jgi:hypothetical protein
MSEPTGSQPVSGSAFNSQLGFGLVVFNGSNLACSQVTRAGWGRAGDSQRAPGAEASDLGGRRPSGVDPSHSLRCNLLVNLAGRPQTTRVEHSAEYGLTLFPRILLV